MNMAGSNLGPGLSSACNTVLGIKMAINVYKLMNRHYNLIYYGKTQAHEVKDAEAVSTVLACEKCVV